MAERYRPKRAPPAPEPTIPKLIARKLRSSATNDSFKTEIERWAIGQPIAGVPTVAIVERVNNRGIGFYPYRLYKPETGDTTGHAFGKVHGTGDCQYWTDAIDYTATSPVNAVIAAIKDGEVPCPK